MEIDKEALFKTKEMCHKELDNMIFKYNVSHIQLFLHFMKSELYNKIIIAFIGLIIVFILSMLDREISVSLIVIYFFCLGALAVYEHLKNEIYHMSDFMKMSYLNEGRVFLYQILTISLYQIISFIILCLFLSLSQLQLIDCILYALLPIYISQILSFHMMNYIKNITQTFCVYIFSYLLIIYIFSFIDIQLLITLKQTIFVGMSVIIIFFIDMIYVYKQRKDGSYGISY